ncbi:unnamed protein product [Rotaria sordida]|uniref:Uncharacterized protein n=1 Tax=Rotaria sordida TaxID=392033 RepID=A0A814EX07_9BILA|nr:unnamed protein product [Rotaria sordida]
MATHYIENASSGGQYYFDTSKATTSQSHRNLSSPVGTYTVYPIGISSSSNQQIRYDDLHNTSQQYQSVGGFNKDVTQHQYQTSQLSTPQIRATARAVNNQDLYRLQRSPQPIQVAPQQHHFQFDTRQQAGHPTGPAVVYQTPGAAQYTHHNVDLWTEGSSQDLDHHAQRVSVRSVSTGSPQLSQSVSPQRHQDHLQQYYSQLTPEQHQQLLRQQQIQRQQEQISHHEQQHQVTAQQVSPSPTYHQEQHRSTGGFDGGQHYQQIRVRSESERQREDEQSYYAAQRQMAAQRAPPQQQQQQQQQQQEQISHPVGIRSLMSKFVGPTSVQQYHPRSKSTSASSRHYSSSTHTSNIGPRQTTTHTSNIGPRQTTTHTSNVGPRQTTTRTSTTRTMTYSALPKPHEPPVNSVEYYQMQMQQQGGNPFTNIQQAAAPAHIQHSPTDFGALRDRFKLGSASDDFNQTQVIQRQQQQQQQQQSTAMTNGGSNLSSLRNQYMNQAKQAVYSEPYTQQVQSISRTILGEDIPRQQQQQQTFTQQGPPQQQQAYIAQVLTQQQPAPVTQVFSQPQQQPAPQVPQQQPAPATQAPQQQSAPAAQASQQQPAPTAETPQQQPAPATEAPQQQSAPSAQAPQQEQSQTSNETVDQSVPSSEVKSSDTTNTATA